jgi:hypothetical protein
MSAVLNQGEVNEMFPLIRKKDQRYCFAIVLIFSRDKKKFKKPVREIKKTPAYVPDPDDKKIRELKITCQGLSLPHAFWRICMACIERGSAFSNASME